MKGKEKILIIILIILFIIINYFNIQLIIKIKKNKKNIQEEHINYSKNQTEKYYSETKLKTIDNKITFYNIKACVNTYFSILCSLWTNTAEQTVIGDENLEINGQYIFNENVASQLIAILAKDYVNKNNIDEDVIKNTYSYLGYGMTIIQDAKEYDIKEGMTLYLVKGYYASNKEKNKKEFNIMIIRDKVNGTFELYPEDYVKANKLDKIDIGERLEQYKDIESIEKNKYNIVKTKIISDEQIAEDYFYLYRFNMMYDQEAAYDSLDNEYKEKRFGDVNEYKIFIKNNLSDLVSPMIEYSVDKREEYTQYVCIDQNGYSYIFRQKNFLEYTLILDTYTIDIPEFVEKYDKANNSEKVILNIQKFINAINDQNYKYAYNCLAENFKKNKFQNIESFKRYITENFQGKIEITYVSFDSIGENYFTYEVKLKDNIKEIKKTFIMKFKEGTDYELSFDV